MVKKQRTLLILDGMEPLQYPPGEVHGFDGKLKDLGLRDAGEQEFLVKGLLARAACFRLQGQFSRAWGDLKEAKEIAEAGDMKLHLVDYHLGAGRVSPAEGKKRDADFHFKKAAQMIKDTGYHRRDEEVPKVS